jgi:hypothetical protein
MASVADGNLWQKLLDNATREEEMHNSTIVMVGNKSSGKSSLLETFQSRFQERPDLSSFDLISSIDGSKHHQTHIKKKNAGSPLEYSFFPAIHPDDNDADMDTAATCDVWTLSSPKHSTFLDFALSKNTLSCLTVVIVLDFTRPSNMVASLKKWLNTVLPEIKKKLDEHPERATIIKKLSDYVRLYRLKSAEGEIGNKSGGSDSTLPTAQIDLSEGVLTTNCGVPIIVCCNKAEVIGEESNSSSGNNCTTSVSIY